MMDLSELLNMARAGHFDTPPERPQEQPQTAADGSPPTDALPVDAAAPGGVLTRHWRMDYPDLSPFRVSFEQPWTAAQLLEQAARNRPDLPAPDLRPLPPDFMTETMQQLTLSLPQSGPETAPEPPETGPTPARVLLEQAGVSVVYVRDLERAAAVVADLMALPDNGGPWGLDIETTPRPEYRGDSKAGLDPYKATIRTAQVYPGGPECYVFDLAALGLPFLEPLWARPMVAHNAVFELKHLLHAGADPQKLGCTLLMANALRGDRPSLADLAADLLGWTLDKTEQTGDWGGALTAAQLDYAALDAVTVFKLAGRLGRDLATRERGRCYILMRDAQRAIARLELAGCPFDTAAHADLMATWQTTAEAARGELDSLLGVNPDSPQQLAGWLKANLPPDVLADWPQTAGGSLATDADTLAGLTLPMLEPLARYKGARKLLSTYGTGYAKHIHPETGRLHPSFLLGATATGRLACRTPNIQNPPRGADFRALFAPAPGRVFVVADYSQIELRVAALVSQDPAMLAAYEAGEDLHRKTAAAVLGVDPATVTKGQRQMAKAINFGLLFGMSAKSLRGYAQNNYGVAMSETEAKAARSAFFAAYPGLSQWQTRTRKAAERAGQVRTPGGRVRPLDGNRALATESLNTPIQGGAAECLLAALADLEPRLLALGAALVNVVHDEMVVECDPDRAADVSAAVEAAMTAGFLAIFPDGSTRDLVEAHSGPNWAAAKP